MASLRKRLSGVYYLEFRYRGSHYHRSLQTDSPAEARQFKAVVERTLTLLKEGVLHLPDQVTTNDLWQFLRSGGRRSQLPQVLISPPLGDICDEYLASFNHGTKEDSTLDTEQKHLNHFQRIFGRGTPIASLGGAELDRYIKTRQQDKSIRGRNVSPVTINKELQTFRQLWEFASKQGVTTGDNPVTRVRKPRHSQKPPFMSWDQIEARIQRGGLTETEIAELWDCLFLCEIEISQFLRHLETAGQQVPRFPFIHAALALCAYTGARRSEMFRCQIDDLDDKVLIREKKRSRDRRITFRDVLMHPSLKSVIDKWLRIHPGGQFLFCKNMSQPLDDKTSREAFAAVTKKNRWSMLRSYHVLRHSFASNLARHGVDQYKIDQFMGHQTDEMRQRYRHLFPEDGEAAIRVLNFSA